MQPKICLKTLTGTVQKFVKAPNLMAYTDGEVDNLGELTMGILHYHGLDATAHCEAISDGKYKLVVQTPKDTYINKVPAWTTTEDFARDLYDIINQSF